MWGRLRTPFHGQPPQFAVYGLVSRKFQFGVVLARNTNMIYSTHFSQFYDSEINTFLLGAPIDIHARKVFCSRQN